MSEQDSDSIPIAVWLIGSPLGAALAGMWLFPEKDSVCQFDPDCTEVFNTTAAIFVTAIGWSIGFAYEGYRSGNSDWYLGSFGSAVVVLMTLIFL
jgi:hypothetical protein